MKHKQNFSKIIDKLTLIEENSQYYSLTKSRSIFENYQPRTNKVQTPMKNETGLGIGQNGIGENGIGESIPSNQIANNKSSTYPEVTNKIFKHMTGWNSSC